MKTQKVNTESKLVKTPALALAGAGALALALMPSPIFAQGRSPRPGYSSPGGSPSSYSPPSLSHSNSMPTYSRPSYTPSSSTLPRTGNAPVYSPSAGGTLSRGGTDFNTLFSRTSPTYSYMTGNFTSPGYRIQQTPAQGQGQNNRSNPPSQGTGGGQNVPGRILPQSSIRQMPLPNVSQLKPNSPGMINGLLTNPSSLNYNRFNNSAEAYRYRYGVPNGNRYFYGDYGYNYFAGGLAYYPYYSPFYSYGYSALSPYAFYGGGFPSFITLGSVYAAPPQYVYVPYPVYQNGSYQGYRNEDVDGYYLNQNSHVGADGAYRVGEGGVGGVKEPAKDAALEATLGDIRAAWKGGEIDPLAKHVRRDAKVAVYLRGKYQYSLDSGDYLDITRDALSATKTVSFTLDNAQRKERGVYTVMGRHVYRDKNNVEHTVYVTYVLEKADSEYVITQVGSAPGQSGGIVIGKVLVSGVSVRSNAHFPNTAP